MRYLVCVSLVLVFLAGACMGDVVYLKDGRKFEGTVTIAGDSVTVQTKFGAATFPRSSVDRIEKKATAEDTYAEKAKAVAANDAKGHYELGLWCKQNGLPREAKAEFEKVIAIDPEHELARTELGYTKIDGKWQQAPPGKIYGGEGEWLTPAEAYDNAQAQYKLEQYDKAQALLEKAIAVGLPVDQRLDAQILLGQIYERGGKWDDVCALYDKLLKLKITPEQRAQLECHKAVIKECKGGMYLVKEATGKEDIFSVDAKDPNAPKKELKGLQPLTDPGVMYLAIREKATARALKGKDYLEQAKKALDGSEEGRKAGLRLLDKADGEFETANLMVKDIARGFQIESVKQRCGMLEKLVEAQLAAIQGQWQGATMDTTKSRLKAQLPQVYARLSEMEKTLDELDQIARRFPEELADEVAKNRAMRNDVASFKTYIRNLADSL